MPKTKKNIKVRDLKPSKDAKGGGKSISGGGKGVAGGGGSGLSGGGGSGLAGDTSTN